VDPPFDKVENEVMLGGQYFVEHLATDWLHLWNEGVVKIVVLILWLKASARGKLELVRRYVCSLHWPRCP
jgi:hypothetical protein